MFRPRCLDGSSRVEMILMRIYWRAKSESHRKLLSSPYNCREFQHDRVYRLDTVCELTHVKIVQNAPRGRPLGTVELAHSRNCDKSLSSVLCAQGLERLQYCTLYRCLYDLTWL
ncbi:hypothetical protein AVEN_65456-1 [Araneus ventricosus]|uniref:Uncharacterized protein n=1 Tax=Araneus ventricosus TaxID=182803 RepID=A0A4Y2II27_ARAVE|nr:hypothetical protein AVEN_65456-1 [Araneus ventricosus]